jgi:hypothetical protein
MTRAIFLHRLFLGITTQMNALAKVIHVAQVVFPLLIQHVQHQCFFKMTHHIRAGFRLQLNATSLSSWQVSPEGAYSWRIEL